MEVSTVIGMPGGVGYMAKVYSFQAKNSTPGRLGLSLKISLSYFTQVIRKKSMKFYAECL